MTHKVLAGAAVLFLAFLLFSSFSKRSGVEPSGRVMPSNESEVVADKLKGLSWQEILPSAPWSKRDAFAAFVFNGKMWLAGGLEGDAAAKGNNVRYWLAPHRNDIWSSPDGVEWKKEADSAAWPGRRSMSVVWFNGKLLMMGGWSVAGGYDNDSYISDDAIHWRPLGNPPPWGKREGQAVKEYKGKLYMIGGVNFDERKTFNDVWVSDDGERWEVLAASTPWSPRYDHDITEYNGKLWLLGGLHLGGKALSDVWVSDDGVRWDLVADPAPWGPRHGLGVLNYRDALWVIGGWDTDRDIGAQSDWFSRDGVNWEKTNADTSWIGREDHAALEFNDRLWVFGGMKTGYHWTNDVWRSALGNQP